MKALPVSQECVMPARGATAYLCISRDILQCTVLSCRKMGRFFIVSCREIEDRETAASFRGAVIAVPASSLPPRAEGEFLHEEIIGLAVVTTTGKEVGRVVSIMQTRAHDVYVVGRGANEYLVPAVKEFIVSVLLDEKKIVVREMEGLFD